jgi:hypothetical protein
MPGDPAALDVHHRGGLAGEGPQAIELFTERIEAERVVENWNRDEPERAGELRVAPIELEASPADARDGSPGHLFAGR